MPLQPTPPCLPRQWSRRSSRRSSRTPPLASRCSPESLGTPQRPTPGTSSSFKFQDTFLAKSMAERVCLKSRNYLILTYHFGSIYPLLRLHTTHFHPPKAPPTVHSRAALHATLQVGARSARWPGFAGLTGLCFGAAGVVMFSSWERRRQRLDFCVSFLKRDLFLYKMNEAKQVRF